MTISPEMLRPGRASGGAGAAGMATPTTNYADMIMKQLATIGQPITSKSTSTSTLEGGGQGMDFGTLAMMLYFLLSGGQGKTSTTESLLATPAPGARQYGNLPFAEMVDRTFGENK